jgi:hypothetical protein
MCTFLVNMIENTSKIPNFQLPVIHVKGEGPLGVGLMTYSIGGSAVLALLDTHMSSKQVLWKHLLELLCAHSGVFATMDSNS